MILRNLHLLKLSIKKTVHCLFQVEETERPPSGGIESEGGIASALARALASRAKGVQGGKMIILIHLSGGKVAAMLQMTWN